MILTSKDELIKLLNLEKYHIKDDEIATLCLNPDHDDRSIGNFFINTRTGQFNCFSCGFHGNIIYLLANKGVSYTKAIRIWKNIQMERELVLPSPPLDRYIINSYISNGYSVYALGRIGNSETLYKYSVYSDKNDNPIFFTLNNRNEYNSVWVRENNHYYLIEPRTAKTEGCLFGEHLKPTEYTFLSEGPFDAMKIHLATGQKSVCGFGTILSYAQIQKLKKFNNLVIFMDGDEAGRKARFKLANYLEDKADLWVTGGYSCDPDEMNIDKIKQVVSDKRLAWQYLFWRQGKIPPQSRQKAPNFNEK